MGNMRAKMQVSNIEQFVQEGETTSEKLSFSAVSKSGPYPLDGSDEDNSFAKWTPSASCELLITNPELFGAFKAGEKYYVDFTPAE